MPKNYISRIFKIAVILFKAFSKGLLISFSKKLFFFNHKIINTHAFFKYYNSHYFNLENYRVLHIHFGNNAVQLIQQLKYFPYKKVVTFHGFDVHKYKHAFYKELINLPNVSYTVNSHYTKGKVIKLGFPETKLNILPVGVDISFFKPIKEPHQEFNILFVGRFIELKAPLLAIKIFEKLLLLTDLKVKLFMIGSGDQFDVCRGYVNSKKLNGCVFLLGNKNAIETRNYMNKADVFLLPGILDAEGRSEAQGLVIQEAQAMQLPVLISDVGGMKEGILDRETGFVVKEKDVNAFVQKLLFFIENPQKKLIMGQTARQFVKERYESSILVERLLDIYKQN